MKRSLTETLSNSTGAPAAKKLKLVSHGIKHRQPNTVEIQDRVQDESVSQKQLLRAIALALSAQGFDEVTPTAMESFRQKVEDYMLSFLNYVSQSMLTSRRQIPTPADFTHALAKFHISPSELLPQVGIPPSEDLTQPFLPFDETPMPIFATTTFNYDDALLFPESATSEAALRIRKYVPNHLPPLPSAHTWQMTEVRTKKDHDALRIRERATQEGVMAERALRALMSDQNSNKADSKMDLDVVKDGKDQVLNKAFESAEKEDETEKQKQDQKKFAEDDMMEEDEEEDDGDLFKLGGHTSNSAPAVNRQKLDLTLDAGLAVNYDRAHWRATGRGRRS